MMIGLVGAYKGSWDLRLLENYDDIAIETMMTWHFVAFGKYFSVLDLYSATFDFFTHYKKI